MDIFYVVIDYKKGVVRTCVVDIIFEFFVFIPSP